MGAEGGVGCPSFLDLGRNPHPGEMVRLRSSPHIRGRITAERLDKSGHLVWVVEWESGAA